MTAATLPRAGLMLLGLLSPGWGLNWPIMKAVIAGIPRWPDFVALRLVMTAIATVLLPARPSA